MKRLMLVPALLLWAQTLFVQAALAASPVIVDGNHVAEAIARNAIIWDVRAPSAYA